MEPNQRQQQVVAYFQALQDQITQALEQTDGQGVFQEQTWIRPGGGGGRSRVLTDGRVLEKGGVGFSEVHGPIHERMRASLGVAEGSTFFASGVSLVMHPWNPNVPIIHMNVRYFELSEGTCWFGGGIDLTPHYVQEPEARWFHQQLKAVLDAQAPDLYEQFKAWADEYFYIPHRNETRGIGGIFYDFLKPTPERPFAWLLALTQAVGNAFVPIYTTLMQAKGELPFTEAQRQWQLLRRGRYAEFNLVYDRGTRFGLETGGRTESILMSLPPLARWAYDHQPEPGSPEDYTLTQLKPGINWAAGVS